MDGGLESFVLGGIAVAKRRWILDIGGDVTSLTCMSGYYVTT